MVEEMANGYLYEVNFILTDPVSIGATADFSQSNVGGVQSQGVSGELLNNGNFIFMWRDDGYFKMVLTSNSGNKIKDGYVYAPGRTWKDPNTWETARLRPNTYSITNFRAFGKYILFGYTRK